LRRLLALFCPVVPSHAPSLMFTLNVVAAQGNSSMA
jgi:hypothetical protein